MIERVVVADSSPLIALAIIDQLELLPRLFQQVFIPPAVWDEITVKGAGLPGASAVERCRWLVVRAPEVLHLAPLEVLVDPGEAQAIALAQDIPGSMVLLDDAKARRVAERFGLPRMGTLGILRHAKRSGLLATIAPHVDTLRRNGIYIRMRLVEAVLRDVGELK